MKDLSILERYFFWQWYYMSSYDSQEFMQVIMDASSFSDLSFEQGRAFLKEQMDLRSTFLN